MIQSGPHMGCRTSSLDAKHFGPVSPGTHRNKFVKESLCYTLIYLDVLTEEKGKLCTQLVDYLGSIYTQKNN